MNTTITESKPSLLAVLKDIELRLTQARIASEIGRQKESDRKSFLQSEMERIGAIAREAIDSYPPEPLGELGLPFNEAGSVLQALAKVLEDRGHENVRENLPDESEFWDTFGGPMVDELGEYMGIGAYPEDKEDPR